MPPLQKSIFLFWLFAPNFYDKKQFIKRVFQNPFLGTSDEDDCGDGDDRDRDLEKLFCPLTDSNGAPYEGQNDQGSERLSASNCRRVQDEIMASLSSFKR